MTQRELGVYLEVTQNAIFSYEAGKATPKFDGLLKLSELFSVGIDDLIWKDLSVEQPSEGMKVEDQIAALEERVHVLEEILKLKAPEIARQLGIE